MKRANPRLGREVAIEEQSRRITEVYLLVMMTLFPIFTGISGYLYLHLKKYLFFGSLTLLWSAWLIVNDIRRAILVRRIPSISTVSWCVGAFFLSATISTLLSPQAVLFSTEIGRYDSLLTYLLYGMILLGVCRFGEKKSIYLYAFAVGYLTCCVIALLQLLGFNALWLYPDHMNYYDPYVIETGRFLSPLGNVDVFSALHCLALPLLGWALLLGREKKRLVLLLPLLLGLAVQLWAGVASGLLALALTMILFLPLGLVHRWEQGIGNRVRLLSWTGLPLLLLVLLILYVVPWQQRTMFELHSALHGVLKDEFGSHRVQIWRETLEVIRQHPLFGIGPGCLDAYEQIHFERYSEALGIVVGGGVDDAHNGYLQALVSFGFMGTLPTLSLLFYTVQEIWRRRESAVVCILVPPFFAYLVQMFFNIETCIDQPLFFILWGLLLSEKTGSENSPSPQRPAVCRCNAKLDESFGME